MGNDLFDPFEEETITKITDDDLKETPKKSSSKVVSIILIVLICLGLISTYIIQNGNFRESQVGRTVFKTNYTKDGNRYFANPDVPGGYEVVDLSIKELELEKRRMTKDGVQIKMLVSFNYWPNQNYLDYQYNHFRATSSEAFEIDKMIENFILDKLGTYIVENDSSWLLSDPKGTQEEIQKLIDEKIRKAFVFEYFGGGKNERLVEYLEPDEMDTEISLESKMFERNKWGNHAYLIESTDDYKKYFVIDDFIRIGSVRVNSVEKCFGE